MNFLLQEFPPVSTEIWEAAIRRDLKGADYTKKLVWEAERGLSIKPYYRSEDLRGLDYLDTVPGEFPYLRGARLSGDWRIREEIEEDEPRRANRAAVAAIEAGADEIEFHRVSPHNEYELEVLLSNLEGVPLHFCSATEELVQLLIKNPLHWSTDLDPFEHLELANGIAALEPGAVLTLDAGRFEEAGATTVQELGFTLAGAGNFLAAIQEFGVEPDRAAALIGFSFAIGSNFFFQIAKLRAFRLLWARVVECFSGTKNPAKTRIHARSSRWNKTIYDPHVNILRGTTEAMSAILGGADSVSVAPFDSCYKAPDSASRRLARDTQIILKQEAQFAKVADPGGGSYYLEALTDSMARESWKTMQEIEALGGFRKASDKIAQALRDSLAAREKAVANRWRVFVGTNKYPDPKETALDRIELDGRSDIHRGAEVFEQIRMLTERYAKRTGRLPRILLAEIGDLKMRQARSNFVYNFFGCAGFEIVQQRFDDTDQIAKTDSDLIVLCSSDSEYLQVAASLLGQLRGRNRKVPVIVAGKPNSVEQLKALGVADFVHVRSNAVEILRGWQERLGVTD